MNDVLVFDVNETLLDVRALDPLFHGWFGGTHSRTQWFNKMIELALVTLATGVYRDFGEVGAAALHATASRRGQPLPEGALDQLRSGMRELPAHPEVRGALERLRGAGFRLASLTNSRPEVGEAQLQHAGLADLFERRLSAHDAGQLKPGPEPYRYAARELGVPLQELRLVAAHDWDVTGALRAGARAALVTRPGVVADPLAPAPDVTGPDLTAVAERLIALRSGA